MDNIYLPHLVTIEDIYERPLTSEFPSCLKDRPCATFDFKAGQFASIRPWPRQSTLHSLRAYEEGLHTVHLQEAGRVTGGLSELHR